MVIANVIGLLSPCLLELCLVLINTILSNQEYYEPINIFKYQNTTCNYTANADLVGSLNVKEAGLALLASGKKPLGFSVNDKLTEGVDPVEIAFLKGRR